jgi:dTDP-glucose 4,6-dehydratase|tara:strand:- start:300 stop:1211 length:912 start_codon:yes stop_codon:yes gene_type:complete
LNKNNRILVVGGTGFIGTNVCNYFKKKRFEVTSISLSRPTKINKVLGVKYLVCDIRNKKFLKKKIKNNFDYVINLAGHRNHRQRKQIIKTDYIGSKNLADFFSEKKIFKFIHIGSGLEYGNSYSPQSENKTCNPKSAFAIAKLRTTRHLQTLNKKKNFPFITLRLYQVYGPFEKNKKIVPHTINNCLNNNNFNCTDGKQIRDFLFVDDLLILIDKVIKKKQCKEIIFNVGSGKPIKLKNLVNKINSLIKTGKPNFGKIKIRKDEQKKLFPNISKVKSTFSWKPKYNYEHGLKKTIKFYKNYEN